MDTNKPREIKQVLEKSNTTAIMKPTRIKPRKSQHFFVPSHSYYYYVNPVATRIVNSISMRVERYYGIIVVFRGLRLCMPFMLRLCFLSGSGGAILLITDFVRFSMRLGSGLFIVPFCRRFYPIGQYIWNDASQQIEFSFMRNGIIQFLNDSTLFAFYMLSILVCLVFGVTLIGAYVLLTKYRIMKPRMVTMELTEQLV